MHPEQMLPFRSIDGHTSEKAAGQGGRTRRWILKGEGFHGDLPRVQFATNRIMRTCFARPAMGWGALLRHDHLTPGVPRPSDEDARLGTRPSIVIQGIKGDSDGVLTFSGGLGPREAVSCNPPLAAFSDGVSSSWLCCTALASVMKACVPSSAPEVRGIPVPPACTPRGEH